jgi:hypothetical protein
MPLFHPHITIPCENQDALFAPMHESGCEIFIQAVKKDYEIMGPIM